TVRSYAAELWVEGLSTGRINNHRVGEILARLINPEKPDVPLNKNDAFQKVQKRRVQEKR
ncbi:hypothetical protein GKG12_19515, partial [Escherichia coli]|nr:hypothetical protein [Escherichia coli]